MGPDLISTGIIHASRACAVLWRDGAANDNNEWRYLEVKEKEVIRCNSIHSTLVDGMIKGISPNTVFLEECPGYVLSLGRNQCCEEECDIVECEKLGITIERRETGGGAGLMVPDLISTGIIHASRACAVLWRDGAA